MKTFLLFVVSFFFYSSIFSQVDTVLIQDFQFDVFQLMDSEPTGDNVLWVNYDEDGLASNLGTEETQRWYGGEPKVPDTINGVPNFVALSSSFLDNFLPGNRNWMILPAQEITDESYMLHWKSAPGQLPRYMDGYQVLLSTSTNDVGSFTDTLFTAASMESITGDSQSTDFSNFSFTPGYLHADGGTDENYFQASTNVNFGILEPHSFDLSEYVGQNVYIAFLHDSDDDESLQIDDILITKAAEPSSLVNIDENKFRMEVYPNPVDQFMFLNFQLEQRQNVSYSIFSTQGKLVYSSEMSEYTSGLQSERLDLSNLSSGNYVVRLNVGGITQSLGIVKR